MVFGAALLCAALFAPPAEQRRLIEAGTFHAGEISDTDAGPWLGLFPDGHRYVWRDAIVDVKAVRDDSVDARDLRTGREVSVRGGASPVFLVRGGEDLRVANVDGYRELELRALRNGDQLKLTLGKQEFLLRVANPRRHGDADMAGSSLELVSNGVTQLLYSAPENASEPAWEILWAGDLDGDGKLDLYLQLGADSGVSERILFVSTMAASGQLVGEFAVFATKGS
ncbi:MAG TPA: hypothetical protein VN893_04555 [Bryobacteraceae bacterium]|nr:hypothetical protein [Bryobacteraceae bacterium]